MTVVEEYSAGMLVEFACIEGYEFNAGVPNITATCLNDGTWSESLLCQGESFPVYSTVFRCILVIQCLCILVENKWHLMLSVHVADISDTQHKWERSESCFVMIFYVYCFIHFDRKTDHCFTTQSGHCLRVGTVLLLQNRGKIFVIHSLGSLNGELRNLPCA